MNFSQLQSFVALADTGSFTEAADMIFLTQSAVSHALASLERELGVTLIDRNRKGMLTLTNEGKKILPHARALLANLEAIQQEASAAKGVIAGKVRLGSVQSMVPPKMLASLLTHFQQQYPEIELVLFEGAMHEVGEWLSTNLIDIGFIVLPAPNTSSVLLSTDEMLALVPNSHRLAQQQEVEHTELNGEPFIMEKTNCALRLMERAGFVDTKPTIRYQASDSSTILAMVREGLGITLALSQMLPTKLDGMTTLRLSPSTPLPLGLAVKSRETAQRGALLLMEVAEKLFANQRASVPAMG